MKSSMNFPCNTFWIASNRVFRVLPGKLFKRVLSLIIYPRFKFMTILSRFLTSLHEKAWQKYFTRVLLRRKYGLLINFVSSQIFFIILLWSLPLIFWLISSNINDESKSKNSSILILSFLRSCRRRMKTSLSSTFLPLKKFSIIFFLFLSKCEVRFIFLPKIFWAIFLNLIFFLLVL